MPPLHSSSTGHPRLHVEFNRLIPGRQTDTNGLPTRLTRKRQTDESQSSLLAGTRDRSTADDDDGDGRRQRYRTMMNSGMSTRRRKLPSSYNNSRYYDLNVPLSSSSSSKQELQNLAQTHQTRLHQLGYHGVAFCHTAYNGRLKVERDDADVALPWKIFLPSSSLLSASLKSSSSSLPSSSSLSLVAKAEADGTPINHSAPPPSSSSTKFSTFGRTHSLTSMKIYRRLNIILEELSDVSRILLHHAGSGVGGAGENEMNEVQTLLQKYDIISLQPMNESVLQSICELL